MSVINNLVNQITDRNTIAKYSTHKNPSKEKEMTGQRKKFTVSNISQLNAKLKEVKNDEDKKILLDTYFKTNPGKVFKSYIDNVDNKFHIENEFIEEELRRELTESGRKAEKFEEMRKLKKNLLNIKEEPAELVKPAELSESEKKIIDDLMLGMTSNLSKKSAENYINSLNPDMIKKLSDIFNDKLKFAYFEKERQTRKGKKKNYSSIQKFK